MDDHHTNDGAIIADVLSGDIDRFSLIVDRYEQALVRFAKSRLGNDDLAEEATQDAFLCAFKWLRSYDSQYSFRTWLWTILLNQCRRQYQKIAKGPKIESWTAGRAEIASNCTPSTGEDQSPPRQLLAKERSEVLAQLLADLPETQADAMRLRFYGGLKYHEIAEAMKCSLSTAKHRVRCGLTTLSQHLAAGETI